MTNDQEGGRQSTEASSDPIVLPGEPAAVHLITGATGFVGSAIVMELLARTSSDIVAIVRATGTESPTERLHRILSDLVDGYQLDRGLLDQIPLRVRAVEGDLEQHRCGVSPDATLDGAELWHCAASLQFQDRHRDHIFRTNVGGTTNAIDLANSIGARHFNHVSTAYVAGSASGSIPAVRPDACQANNQYEMSKVAGEQLVLDSGLPYRIMRPGVVIGHSTTYHTTSTDGLYGFLRALIKYRRALERTQAGLSQRRQIKLVADPSATIDLIPVDIVAEEAVSLSLAESLSLADADNSFYHLTNPQAPNTAEVIARAFLAAGLLEPELVSDSSQLDPLELKLHQRLAFYSSYLVNPKRFDRTSIETALAGTARLGFALPNEAMDEFCDWYVERFEQSRPKLPVAR